MANVCSRLKASFKRCRSLCFSSRFSGFVRSSQRVSLRVTIGSGADHNFVMRDHPLESVSQTHPLDVIAVLRIPVKFHVATDVATDCLSVPFPASD